MRDPRTGRLVVAFGRCALEVRPIPQLLSLPQCKALYPNGQSEHHELVLQYAAHTLPALVVLCQTIFEPNRTLLVCVA